MLLENHFEASAKGEEKLEELVQILERNKGQTIVVSYGSKESYLSITYEINGYDVEQDMDKIHICSGKKQEKGRFIIRQSDITDMHIDGRIIYLETETERINLLIKISRLHTLARGQAAG